MGGKTFGNGKYSDENHNPDSNFDTNPRRNSIEIHTCDAIVMLGRFERRMNTKIIHLVC